KRHSSAATGLASANYLDGVAVSSSGTGAVVLRGPRYARAPQDDGSGHSRRDRNLADILRHLVALLRCRALGDCDIPAFHVWILVEIDGLPFVARHPRPDRDIRDRIIIGHVFMIGEPPVEHAVEPVRLFQIALLGVRRL